MSMSADETILTGKYRRRRRKSCPRSILSAKISHGLAWNRTRDIVVTLQRLTASSLHGLERQILMCIIHEALLLHTAQ